jgi:hypothetical protein
VQAGSGKYKAIEGNITAKIGSPSQTTLPIMEDFVDIKDHIDHFLRKRLGRSYVTTICVIVRLGQGSLTEGT